MKKEEKELNRKLYERAFYNMFESSFEGLDRLTIRKPQKPRYDWDRLKHVILPEGITKDELERVVNYLITIGVLEDIVTQKLR